jgi:uncharacterized protein YwqG
MMAQISLEELGAAGVLPEWLPRSGTLTFFYDLDNEPWGNAPEDASAAKVIFVPSSAEEFRVASPPADLARDLVLPALGVVFEPELTLPAPDSDAIRELGLSDEQLDRFDDVRAGLAGLAVDEPSPVHRMFGYPDEIQESLVDEGSQELLLQLSADEALNLEIGDDGRLYFLMPAASDLEERLSGTRTTIQVA